VELFGFSRACNYSSIYLGLPILNRQALKSSFDIYPIHYFEYLSSVVASVVGAPVLAAAVDVAVVALRALRKQNTCLNLLVSVP